MPGPGGRQKNKSCTKVESALLQGQKQSLFSHKEGSETSTWNSRPLCAFLPPFCENNCLLYLFSLPYFLYFQSSPILPLGPVCSGGEEDILALSRFSPSFSFFSWGPSGLGDIAWEENGQTGPGFDDVGALSLNNFVSHIFLNTLNWWIPNSLSFPSNSQSRTKAVKSNRPNCPVPQIPLPIRPWALVKPRGESPPPPRQRSLEFLILAAEASSAEKEEEVG